MDMNSLTKIQRERGTVWKGRWEQAVSAFLEPCGGVFLAFEALGEKMVVVFNPVACSSFKARSGPPALLWER